MTVCQNLFRPVISIKNDHSCISLKTKIYGAIEVRAKHHHDLYTMVIKFPPHWKLIHASRKAYLLKLLEDLRQLSCLLTPKKYWIIWNVGLKTLYKKTNFCIKDFLNCIFVRWNNRSIFRNLPKKSMAEIFGKTLHRFWQKMTSQLFHSLKYSSFQKRI